MQGLGCLCNTYCSSNFSFVTFEHITNVTFAGINNSSGGTAGGPVNYTGVTGGTVTAGTSATMSVSILADVNEYVFAWIDWNQNGLFTDPGEQYTIASNVGNNGPHTLSIPVPATATSGSTRLRVMLVFDNALSDPCISETYGEAEDYSITVINTPPCAAPSSLAASAITFNSADVSWVAVPGGTGYEYLVDQNAGTPSGAGTAAKNNTATVSSLLPSTVYYLHVRTDCGGASYSTWAIYSFTALAQPSTTPTPLSISNITQSSADLAWTAITGATGYEYLVDMNSGTPAGAGTATTATTASAPGLTPST